MYREIVAKITSEALDPGPTVRKIGDCDAPAIIAAAIYAGHRYARELETDSEQEIIREEKTFARY